MTHSLRAPLTLALALALTSCASGAFTGATAPSDRGPSAGTGAGAATPTDGAREHAAVRAAVRVRPTARLPLRFVRRLPMVRIRVAGQGPFTFIVDTGAGTPIVVSERLARRLRLPSRGTIDVLSQGRFTTARKTMVPTVQLGDLELVAVDGIVQDLTAFRPLVGDDYDGLLGYPLFRGLTLTLDYPEQAMELRPAGDQFEDGGEEVMPYQLVDRTPVIAAVVGRWQAGLTLDTGSSFGVVLPRRLAGKLRLATPVTRGPSSLGVTGRVDHRHALLDGSVRLASHELHRPRIVFGEGLIGLLGGGVLRRFRVSLDPVRRTVRFERPADARPAAPAARAGDE